MGKRTIRVRRTFTPQFKKDAVHLVVEEGKSLTEVATHLGIARSLLQRGREGGGPGERRSGRPGPAPGPGGAGPSRPRRGSPALGAGGGPQWESIGPPGL